VSQEAFDEELGRRLGEHRKSLGVSQEYLGVMLQRDQTYISKIETGKRSLSAYELVRWSKALNLPGTEVNDLIFTIESNAA
jgi:transcriptional regulator with XRE-family HTH domain